MRYFAGFCKTIVIFLAPAGAAFGAVQDFEGFTTGSVNGQFGWTVEDSFGNGASIPFDQEIVDIRGNKAWRLSNAVAKTSFSDHAFSAVASGVAGETGSFLYNDYGTDHTAPNEPPLPGAGANADRMTVRLDFKSVTGAFQDGLFVALSPSAKQSPVRMSYLGIEDTAAGFNLLFYDTNDGANWFGTTVASGLSHDAWHSITMDVQFVDGLDTSSGSIDGNDIVAITVDGSTVHTGTTWESYYDAVGRTQAVDSMLFRVSSAAPDTLGGGLYFDNVQIETSQTVVPEPSTLAIWSVLGLAGVGVVGLRRRRVKA